MQMQELQWFAALVEDPNVTHTAARLHISQPALSRSLRRLEASVGVQLFDRVGRSLVPNEHGRALAEHVRRALTEIQTGIGVVRRAADPEAGEIRLAFLHTLGVRLVPELIKAYSARHPAVRFRLSEAGSATILEGLHEGRHDIVLTGTDPADDRLSWRPLFREPLRLAVPPDHRLAGRRRVRLAEVAEDPFIVVKAGFGLRGITDALCARAGFAPQVAFEGEDVETLRGLVAAGLGVSLLPERANGSSATPLLAVADADCARTIGLAWHRTRYRSPAVRMFADFIAHHRVEKL
jgi:LysR family transcriptional regulator, transcription activator of glutamate synthase operon